MAINSVNLVGNLTRDPELKYTSSGTARTRFTIAVNRIWYNDAGEKQEDVSFIPIIAWAKTGENCANYLSKGRQVAVSGYLRMISFTGDDGERRNISEVIAREVQFLGGKPSEQTDTLAPAADQADSPIVEEVPF